MASVIFSAFCQDCGAEVKPCSTCEKHGDADACGSSSFICLDCKRSIEWQEEVKQMSSDELYEAQEDVDYDRRKHCVRLRGRTWTAEDQAMHDRMDKWALIIWNEMRRRSSEKVKLNARASQQ